MLLMVACSRGAEPETEPSAAETSDQEPVAPPKPGEMILIPAGEFIMGSNKKGEGRPALEGPEHKVQLPAYYIDAYEVTFGEWIKFVNESGYQPEGNWRQFYAIGKEYYPVANVTWEDAKAYAKWAGKRLPTEAEWEKAARGTQGFAYPWGNEWSPSKCNCYEYGFRDTMEIGKVAEDISPYRVHDMMGNVQEWTADLLKPYPGSPAARDVNFSRNYVVVRGASYAMKGGSMTLWVRSGYYPKSLFGLGFRCAKDAESAPSASREGGKLSQDHSHF